MAVYFFNPRNTKTFRNKNWESFCCFNCSELKDGRLQCNCGENVGIYGWHWEKQTGNTVVLSLDDREVLFHPVYSSGTAAVRGIEPFRQNYHHYWEIKVLTNLYGTDIMIGVGTSKVTLGERQYKFCSMLGYDNQSWGYSYHGVIQHDRLIRKYGPLFGLGSIIGVHLDMCTGTLEYYLNRKPLGVAFKGLKCNELYPMVSSTAAQSALRMTCSLSLQPTLQLKCLMVIKKHPKLVKEYHSIPGLSRLIRKEYFWLIPPDIKVGEEKKDDLTLEDEAVLPLHTILKTARHRKRLRTNKWGIYEARSDPDHISYRSFMRKANEDREREEFQRKLVLNKHPSKPHRREGAPDREEKYCKRGTTENDDKVEPSSSDDNDNLVIQIQSHFQEAIKTLSSTIDIMMDVSNDVATDIDINLNEAQGASSECTGDSSSATDTKLDTAFKNNGIFDEDSTKDVACYQPNRLKNEASSSLNSMDDNDVIIRYDGYLNCVNYQDDSNLSKPSSSSAVYNDIDDYDMENDLSSLENRYCNVCSSNLGTSTGFSQNTCSICDVVI